MVDGAHDAGFEPLIFGAVETPDHNHETVHLREIQPHSLCLCSNILNRLATVYPHYFILISVFEYLKEGVDKA